MADLFSQTSDAPVKGKGAAVERAHTEEADAAGADAAEAGSSPADAQTFESALKQLEGAVEKLEEGNLSLSDALKLFEDGLRASNACRTRLEEAKQKVELLLSRNGDEFRVRDLDLGEM